MGMLPGDNNTLSTHTSHTEASIVSAYPSASMLMAAWQMDKPSVTEQPVRLWGL